MQPTQTEQSKLAEFAEKYLQTPFQNYALLKEALTHRSYLNEVRDQGLSHNERLEFLGDAVLELITTEYLFNNYPDRPEGELTSFRAALVRTESLADEAQRLNYGDFIFMSKGEESTGGRKRPYILANTFEAVLGAIYLDQGLKACEDFLRRVLMQKADNIVKNRLDIDAKSKLQELAQEIVKVTPSYTLVSEEGPDHDKTFTMGVVIDGVAFGSGKGHSKQEAEQSAARQTLENWTSLYENYLKSGKIPSVNK